MTVGCHVNVATQMGFSTSTQVQLVCFWTISVCLVLHPLNSRRAFSALTLSSAKSARQWSTKPILKIT